MRKSNVLNIFGAVLAMAMLAGCGGGASFDKGTGTIGGGGSTGGSSSSSGGTVSSGVPGTLTLTAAGASSGSSASIPVDDGTTPKPSITLTAVLVDTTNAPIANKTITFATSAGTLSPATGTTDSTGSVTVQLKSGIHAGTATIRASEPTGIAGYTSVTFTASPLTPRITLTVASTTVAPGGAASVNAQVTDANGNPLSGQIVNFGFTANSDNHSGGSFAATQVTTDANGRASTTYQAGPTSSATPDKLLAALAGPQSASALLTVAAGTAQIGSITLQLGSSTAVADGAKQTAASATVKDTAGNPLPNVTVNFSTSAATLTAATAVTNASGVATVQQISPTQVGNATITAFSGGFSASQNITFIAGTPSGVLLSVSPTNLVPDGTASVRAIVLDTNGNRVPNVAVTFASTTSIQAGGARFGSNTVTSDANGEASTQYIAPANATTFPTDSVRAKTAGGQTGPNVTVNISSSNATITGITVVAGTTQVAAGQSTTLHATVQTSSGAIAGIPVTFSAPGATLNPANGIKSTDANGNADLPMTVSNVPGNIQVTATAGGFSAQTTVQVVAGAPDHIAVTVASSPVVPGGTASITAQVLDSANNPVGAGQQVNFNITSSNTSGSTLSPATAITDANGNVSASFVAGGTTLGSEIVKLTAGSAMKTANIAIDPTASRVGNVIILVNNGANPSTAVQIPAGGTEAVTAVVTDASGNPLAGQTVNFSGTAGSFNPTSDSTGSDGKVHVTYQAPTVSGQAELTAVSGGVRSTQGVIVVADSPANIVLSVSPTALAPSGKASVSATVFDQFGNRIDGALQNVQVNFSAASQNIAGGGSFVVAQPFVDVNGQASTTYTAPSVTGSDTVTATVSGITPQSQSVTIAPSNTVIGNVTVTALTSSIPADGITTATVRAHVTDSSGAVVQGASVGFTSTAGSPTSSNVPTDASGNADFVLTAANVPGTATVTGSIGGFSNSATVTFTAGAPNAVSVALNPPSVSINGQTTVSATVLDGSNNPVPGATVNFSSPVCSVPPAAPVSCNNSHGSFGSASAITNASGVASTTYTAGNANSATQKDTINAKVAGATTQGTADLIVVVQPGSLIVTSAQASITADGSSTTAITAKLLDTNGNAIPNRTINFKTNAGNLAATGAGPFAAAASVNSDANGQAIIILQSGVTVGTATVTATDPSSGVSNSVNVTFKAGAAQNVTLSVAPTTVNTGGTASINVQVTDANANPVPGAVVTLGFNTTAPAVGNVSGGQYTASLITTDANGRASTTYQTGPTTGTDNLQASLAGGAKSNQNLIVNAGAVQIGSITLTLGSSTAAVSPSPFTAGTAVKTTATATVKDTAGNPLNGQTVTFSTSAGSMQSGAAPAAVTVTGTTDTNGRVSVSQLSPTQVGNAVITASTAGFTDSQMLTFTARAPSLIVVSASPTDLVPGGAAAASALVLDDNGNPVPNVQVTFKAATSTQAGGASFATTSPITTSANGTATTQYIAPTKDGTGAEITSALTDTLTAVTAGVSTSNSVTINVSPNNALVTGLTLSAETPNVHAGKDVNILATVTVSGGSRAGIPIVFETPTPTHSSLSTLTPSTDVNGVATTKLTAPNDQGTVHIVARVGNFTQTLDVPVVSGDPDHINAGVASSPVVPGGTATITAQVIDSNNNPVGSGHMVRFKITSANTSKSGLDFASGFTDSQGLVSVNFLAGTALGVGTAIETVAITTDDGTATLATPLSIKIDPAASRVGGITLSTANSRMTVNGTQQVLVTVTDEAGKPLAGQTVSLTATDGSFSAGPFVTGADGKVAATYTAAADDSQVTLTASSGGFTTSQAVTVVADTPATVVVNAAPIQIAPNATASITATVFDAQGNAVPNTTVAFTATTGTLSVSTATTDDSGNVTVSFKGSTAGSATITAAAKQGGATVATGTTTVQVAPNVPVIANLTVTALATSIPADGVSTAVVRAHVTDSTGAPISGVTVNFTSTVGAGASSATDSNGNADFTQTAANVPGSATVTAVAGGFAKSATVSFVAGPPTNVTLQVTPVTANINSNVSLSASVKDAKGNPVSGITVNFDVPTNSSGGTLSSASEVTNPSGVASVTYRTGANAGSDAFTATVASVVPATGGVTVQVLFGSLTLTSTSSSVIADGTSTTTLVATLKDPAGSPVSGQSVTFSSSAGSLPAGAVSTDGSGQARIILTSPVTTGNATITANVPGVTASGVVQFVAGPATTLAVTATPGAVAPGGSSSLVATLTDTHGNAVEGATVGFTFSANASGASLDKAQGTTDLNGQVQLVYTAGSTIGMDTISANAGNGVTTTASISVSATTSLVGGLSLTLGSSTATAGDTNGVTASALVKDTTGTAVGSGQSVTFTATDGTLVADGSSCPTSFPAVPVTSLSATTVSGGIARVIFCAPTHTMPVVDIRASANGFSDEKTLSVKAGPAVAAHSSITANPSSLLANGTSTATITVIEGDANGNALPDGTSVTIQSTAGTLASNTATLSSGRATFTLTAPSTSGTAAVTVPAISGLSTTMTFTGASTGDPAALGFTVTNSQISVTGVGQNQQTQITVTVLDSAGNPIDESKYGDATLNNLEAKFITQPNGGETLSGTQASGTIATASSGVLDVRTNNGVTTLTLSSGTISGIIELQFSVLKFTGGSFAVPANVAASGALPQVSIAAGPPASMNFSGPITNAVEIIKNGNGTNSGNYGLHGKVDVRDRYGNFVPDGTIVNFALMDSVILQDNTGTTAASSPNLTRSSGNSLINRRCTTQPGGTPNAPTEASGCNALGTNTASSDFNSTITRNGVARGILNGDLILLRDTVSSDKKRTVSSVTGATQMVANSNYGSSANNAMFWTGSALSGGAISGFKADGTTLTPGTGVVVNGYAPFRVDYPANTGSILLGCYGYGSNGVYSDVDLRDAVPQSRQVVLSADASSVSTIDAGDFCFKAVAGATLTPTPATLSLSNSQSQNVTLDLRDGGDTVLLPYMPIGCFQTAAKVQGVYSVTATIVPDSDGETKTGINGTANVIFTAGPGTGVSGDSVTYTCTGADASTDITISHP